MGSASALVALLLATSPASPQPPAPLTYNELRTLPDEELTVRLFGPLANDLVLGARPEGPRTPSILRVMNLWAWTRPRPSDRPGVCETDRSILVFERDSLPGGFNRENPALRLARIDTQTYYIVHDRALAEGRARPDPDHPGAWGAACATLDPRRDAIPADNSWQLMHARELLDELGEAARAGRSEVPIDCARMYWNRQPPADTAACLNALRYLRADLIGWVSDCRGVPAAANCIRVLVSEMFIEFSLDIGQQVIAIGIQGVEDNSAVE